MNAVELCRVTRRFGRVVALDGVDLEVADGDSFALLGPNGAGKSTALAVALGLRSPDEGVARLYGRDPRLPATRAVVGVTPQETAFPATLRVRELIDLVRSHFARPVPTAQLVECFGLHRLVGRQLGGLSGGERRVVAVALAFAGAPRLVVLDEPTAGLDAETRGSVWDAIRSHLDDGGTLLLTTHHLDEAESLARRVAVLEDGQITAQGTVDEIKAAAGLTRVSYRSNGSLVSLDVSDGGAAVEQLVRESVPLTGLEVRPLTLEEALAARRST